MNKKTLKWNLIYQYGWVLTNIVNSLLLLPLYLKNIELTTLGVWLATGSIMTWMTLTDPGVGEVLQQRIAEERGKQNEPEVSRLIGSGFIASLLIFALSILVGLVCYAFIGVVVHKNVSDYDYLPAALIISIVATGLSLVSFTLSGINQGLHNAAPVAISAFSANFLFLAVNVVLLFMGYGVLSIAMANLARALYINLFNIVAMFRYLRRQAIGVLYDWAHLKRFSWIFSYTSASKIISGFANSFDLLILARFISPASIAIYEINKRPANITYSLIGRHSVALMPLISHAAGTGDQSAIRHIVRSHFRFYTYASLFIVFLFCFNYPYLIAAWTGPENFAGMPILYLIVANLFIMLMGYFMSNIGYALGDIRKNSSFNIARGIIYGVLIFFAAKYYGIIGTLSVSIFMALVADLFFFSWRVNRLGYLGEGFLQQLMRPWMLVIPVTLTGGWLLSRATASFLPDGHYFYKLLLGSSLLTGVFLSAVLIADHVIRDQFRKIANKYLVTPVSRLRGASRL